MDNWWTGMDWFERVLWIIAIPSTLVFLVQLLMSFIGADADVDSDFSGDLDGEIGEDSDASGAGFQVFTIRNFVIFMTIFSWSGITFNERGMDRLLNVGLSFVLGVIAMLVVAGIFYFFHKMTESGTLHLSNAIGRTAEVYLPLKAKRGNVGKVQVSVQGSLRELNALTDDEHDLTTGTVVIVTEILHNSILIVKKP